MADAPTTTDKPTWEPLWLSCKACGHWWDDWQPCHVPIPTWVQHVLLIRCPACGGGEGHTVLIRTQPLSERPCTG